MSIAQRPIPLEFPLDKVSDLLASLPATHSSGSPTEQEVRATHEWLRDFCPQGAPLEQELGWNLKSAGTSACMYQFRLMSHVKCDICQEVGTNPLRILVFAL